MDDAKKDLFWVIFFLIIIALVWYYTGGPNRPTSQEGLFLYKPQERYSEEVKSTTEKIIGTAAGISLEIDFDAIKQSDPQKEYIKIKTDWDIKSSTNISDWTLENKNGIRIKLGAAANLLLLPGIGATGLLSPSANETIYVTSGQSPIGMNFRLNKCTGYLAQMQTFIPELSLRCPHLIKDELLPAALDNACIDYLNQNYKTCIAIFNLPSNLSTTCKDYANYRTTYNGCADWHKNDSDFYDNEWRVYLNNASELWDNNHDTVTLRDENGKIIDQRSY
ncbi:MAG: hypothetical protein HY773_00685 [Candidatus Terrybacteria bacterium]|nr:hypothetical protein [Candidatus Terrybacteria bacterium]